MEFGEKSPKTLWEMLYDGITEQVTPDSCQEK